MKLLVLQVHVGSLVICCCVGLSLAEGIENITLLPGGTLPPVRVEITHKIPEFHEEVEKFSFVTLPPQPPIIHHVEPVPVPVFIEERRSFQVMCPDCLPSFKGGEDIFPSMSQWTNLVCGKSVCEQSLDQDKCGNKQCDKCHCDEECVRYGDCCPDLFMKIPHKTAEAETGCVSQAFISAPKISSLSFKMVDTCPEQTNTSDTGRSLAARCRNPNVTEIEDNIPVYSSQTKFHYKSLNCAKCNGLSEVVHWVVKPFCNDYVDFSQVSSPQDLLSLMRHTNSCVILFHPPRNSFPRECRFPGSTIKTCNVSGEWADYDPDVERACQLYSQPVVYFLKTYENIFCLSCNGAHLDKRESCTNSITTPTNAPFSVLLDFRQTMKEAKTETTLCSEKEVFDPILDGCRTIICPVGKYPKNHTCTSLFESAQGLGYVLHFSLTPVDREFFSVDSLYGLAYKIFDSIVGEVYLFHQSFFIFHSNITFRTTEGSSEYQVYGIEAQFSTLVGAHIPRDLAEEQLLALLRRKWWWYDLKSGSFTDMEFKWLPGVSDKWLKPLDNRFWYELQPYDKIRTESILITEQKMDVEIPKTFFRNISAYIVVSELLSCNIVELNTSEYTTLQTDRIYVNSTGQILVEGQFMWNGDRIQVCTNLTGEDPKINSTGDVAKQFDPTEVTLTLVCMCLSLCGLAATTVIYIAIPSLRRQIPGKNNLFLFVNLFVAQLLFLSGTTAQVSAVVCRTLAIVIHYFWLSTFCWKGVCAFHMYRLFTNPLKTMDPKKTLCRYISFSQLFPCFVIILIISVNLGLSDTAQIGYAGRPSLCFLTGTLDVALGFAFPVGLVILVNVFFFSRVIYAIRHRPKMVRHVKKSDAQNSVIYFKMSLILGFTWVLGFFALIVDVPWLWYVFTVANGGLGVFVFLSFGLKNITPMFLKLSNFKGEGGSAAEGSKTYETHVGSMNKTKEGSGEPEKNGVGSIHNSPQKDESNHV